VTFYRSTLTHEVWTREELENGKYIHDLYARQDVDPEMSMTFEEWVFEAVLNGHPIRVIPSSRDGKRRVHTGSGPIALGDGGRCGVKTRRRPRR
jgi:hypothetical protein